VRQWFARVAGRAVERPTQVVVAAILLTLIGTIAALRLETNAGVDTLVDRGSPTYAATQDFKAKFGDDAVAILVKGDLGRLLLTADLGRLLGLESCLSGTAPGGQVFKSRPTPVACTQIAALQPSHVVYGPATFLNQFAIQSNNLYTQQAQAVVADARAEGLAAAKRAKQQGYGPAGQQQAALAAAQQVQSQFQSTSASVTASPACRGSTTPSSSARWSLTAVLRGTFRRPASRTCSPAPTPR